MTDLEEVAEERRVPDDEQPLALALAEEAGILPEEDRRHEDDPTDEEPVVEEESVPDATGCETCGKLEKAGVGSVLEKQGHGWKVKFVDGGTVILTEGQTITEALHVR